MNKPVLLFDLGGVIMNINKDRCADSFRRLGMENPGRFLGDYGQKGPFLELEEGKITSEEFRAAIRPYFAPGVTDEQIDDAFCDFLLGIPVERLRQLEKLHATYNIYMLSNTNPIMWHRNILNEFKKDGHDVDYYFDGCMTSFDAKVCKPDARIFELTLSRFGLKAEEVTFLDDSEANCRAAEALGLRALHVPSDRGFYTLLTTRTVDN